MKIHFLERKAYVSADCTRCKSPHFALSRTCNGDQFYSEMCAGLWETASCEELQIACTCTELLACFKELTVLAQIEACSQLIVTLPFTEDGIEALMPVSYRKVS